MEENSNMQQCVDIAINQDGVFESSETFMVSLSTSDNAVTLTTSSINVIILDFDEGIIMTM